MSQASTNSQERFLIVAGVLGLTGLATALLYVLHSTPYTMVLYMGAGIAMIVLAALMFAFVIVGEIRSRLTSMTDFSFKAGETLGKQGDPAEFMYVISEGEVEFFAEEEGKEPIRLGQLGPADYFGDMAILSGTPYQATARAMSDVRVLAIHQRDFKSMHTNLPHLRKRVQKEQQRKLKMVEENVGESRS